MSAYLIEGGRPLEGSVEVHGAKNSVLPILAACLLSPGVCVVRNCPRLTDVEASLAILRHLGCRAERQGDAVVVDASAPTGFDVPDALMREMRSSVIFLGAILGRMGQAQMCAPGGASWGPGPSTSIWLPSGLWGAVWRSGAAASSAPAGSGERISYSPCPAWGPPRTPCWRRCAPTGPLPSPMPPGSRRSWIFRTSCGPWGPGPGAGSSVITVEGGVPLHGGATG